MPFPGTRMDWLTTFAGFSVGLIVGVTGVGGGSLMTPLLVLLFGVAPVTAVGTDLLFAAVTGATPNSRTSSGVISEPPPTPVTPTIRPTVNPAKVVSQSMRVPEGKGC